MCLSLVFARDIALHSRQCLEDGTITLCDRTLIGHRGQMRNEGQEESVGGLQPVYRGGAMRTRIRSWENRRGKVQTDVEVERPIKNRSALNEVVAE